MPHRVVLIPASEIKTVSGLHDGRGTFRRYEAIRDESAPEDAVTLIMENIVIDLAINTEQ